MFINLYKLLGFYKQTGGSNRTETVSNHITSWTPAVLAGMLELLNLTNSSNMLPIVEKGKCLGCTETARDTDVLHCFLCKKQFHVINCAVAATLGRDDLPAKTNLTNYIKFSSQSYPTGNFIWTCFRCGVIKEMSSSDNIEQRVGVLESLLITMSPALTALAKSAECSNEISSMISDIRASTSAHQSSPADGHPTGVSETPSLESELASNDNNLPMSPAVAMPPHNVSCDISTDPGQLANLPILVDAPFQIAHDGCLDDSSQTTASALTEHHMRPKPAGTKIKIKITSEEDGPLLRNFFHRAHTVGKIDSYSIRYHSNHKADLIFQNVSEAEAAHLRISQLDLNKINLGIPTCMNTKMVHIVGLTEDDSKESLYEAICKPGRNHAIGHLINPCTLRVVNINPCNRNSNVYRASVIISEEIWDIILNKMNSKLKIGYLTCSVFLRLESIRCYRCQHLGHTAQTCKKDIRCVNCGEGHSLKECQNSPKCVNCVAEGVDSSHRADSPDCSTYKSFRKGSAKN